MAVGDFNGDGREDLAVGSQRAEINGKEFAGEVRVYNGMPPTVDIRLGLSQIWNQDLSGLWESAEVLDRFGRSLASGDFNNDGVDDLVIGVPYEDLIAKEGTFRDGCEPEEFDNAGVVHIIYGTVAEGLYVLTDPAQPDAPPGAKQSQIFIQGK